MIDQSGIITEPAQETTGGIEQRDQDDIRTGKLKRGMKGDLPEEGKHQEIIKIGPQIPVQPGEKNIDQIGNGIVAGRPDEGAENHNNEDPEQPVLQYHCETLFFPEKDNPGSQEEQRDTASAKSRKCLEDDVGEFPYSPVRCTGVGIAVVVKDHQDGDDLNEIKENLSSCMVIRLAHDIRFSFKQKI